MRFLRMNMIMPFVALAVVGCSAFDKPQKRYSSHKKPAIEVAQPAQETPTACVSCGAAGALTKNTVSPADSTDAKEK